jgi:hypothetical protein
LGSLPPTYIYANEEEISFNDWCGHVPIIALSIMQSFSLTSKTRPAAAQFSNDGPPDAASNANPRAAQFCKDGLG